MKSDKQRTGTAPCPYNSYDTSSFVANGFSDARRVHLEGIEKKHGSKTLSSLAGLGPKSEAMLVQAGITSRQLGAVRAFAMVKQAGLGPSINLLWALEGGLSGQHWQQAAREHRTSLLLALEHLERSRK